MEGDRYNIAGAAGVRARQEIEKAKRRSCATEQPCRRRESLNSPFSRHDPTGKRRRGEPQSRGLSSGSVISFTIFSFTTAGSVLTGCRAASRTASSASWRAASAQHFQQAAYALLAELTVVAVPILEVEVDHFRLAVLLAVTCG